MESGISHTKLLDGPNNRYVHAVENAGDWTDWTMSALALLPAVMALLLPSTINPWGYNAFELPKVVLLRGCVILISLLIYGQLRTQTGYGRNRGQVSFSATSILWPTLALFLSLVLATISSVNRYASIWGAYDRQQGLITHVTYFALFFATAYGLRSRRHIERLWHALIWGSIPVVAYGLLQISGLDPIDWDTSGASQVLSSLGRSNFLGSYLVLIFPLTVGLALYKHCLPIISNDGPDVEWNPIAQQNRLARTRGVNGDLLLLIPLMIGQIICLAATQARSAWMGIFVSMLILGLLWGMIKRQPLTIVMTLLAVALVCLFLVLIVLPNGPLAALTQVQGFDRLGALGNLHSGSTAARLAMWKEIAPLISTRPWLGFGPETMRPVFDQVFPPHLVFHLGHNVAADRAHNIWLDTAMISGIAGASAYGWLLLALGWLAWSGLRSAKSSRQQVFWAVFIATMLGHVTDMQFSFNVTTTATIFWIVLGLGFAQWRLQQPTMNPNLTPISSGIPAHGQRSFGAFTWIAVASACCAVIILCGLPLWADSAYRQVQNTELPIAARSDAGRKAVGLWPFEPQYRLGLAATLQMDGHFEQAVTQLSRSQPMMPADAQMWSAWGNLYTAWGESDPSKHRLAVNAYQQATVLAPSIAHHHAQLGLALIENGQRRIGTVELKEAAELDGAYQEIYAYFVTPHYVLKQSP